MKEIKYTIIYCVCENFSDSIYYSSGSETVIIYGSDSAPAKSYGSYSSGSAIISAYPKLKSLKTQSRTKDHFRTEKHFVLFRS